MNTLLEAIDLLVDGVNPMTGEVFDKAILSDDRDISLAITRLALSTQPHLKIDKSTLILPQGNPNSHLIFRALKRWRLDHARTLGLPAYCVFTDEELRNISDSFISRKEDLLMVKGIAKNRYEAYADELYELLSEYV